MHFKNRPKNMVRSFFKCYISHVSVSFTDETIHLQVFFSLFYNKSLKEVGRDSILD